MSANGAAQRLSVFAVFTALAALVAFQGYRSAAPAHAPTTDELAALEAGMAAGARLHPALPKAEPRGSAPFCAGCHQLPAHSGRRVADAMKNEHAARMDCLLCHWSAASGTRPTPTWQVPAGSPVFLAVLPAERATKEQLTALRSAVKATRACFERGPACSGCHRPGGMAGLVQSASPGRDRALENLENYSTLAPGEKWYFPQIQ